MTKSDEIEEALQKMLAEWIYRLQPHLVRNDSLTSRTIKLYLCQEVPRLRKLREKPWSKLTPLEFDKQENIEVYTVILGLSEESLRKYIRLLWKQGSFNSYFQQPIPDLGN